MQQLELTDCVCVCVTEWVWCKRKSSSEHAQMQAHRIAAAPQED